MKNFTVKNKQVTGLLSILSLVFFCVILWYYVMIFRQNQEPSYEMQKNRDSNMTSVQQFWMLQGFEELSHMITFQIPIPGLNYTETLYFNNKTGCYDPVFCTSMTPQGICVAQRYLLISAYCHTEHHNSVIFVLDKKSGAYEGCIVLDGTYHAGGLAYDTGSKRVWIALGMEAQDTIAGFSLVEMENYLQRNPEDTFMNGPIPFSSKCKIEGLKSCSFITFYNKDLFVGQFMKTDQSIVYQCRMNQNHDLLSIRKMKLPKKIQGIAVFGDIVLLSQSYGLTKSSLIVHNYIDTAAQLDDETHIREFMMPQKMQQIYIDGDDLYVIFESAAYAYRAQPFPKIDRVLKLDLRKIVEDD